MVAISLREKLTERFQVTPLKKLQDEGLKKLSHVKDALSAIFVVLRVQQRHTQ